MWLKSVSSEDWINMSHITHLSIRMTPNQSSETDAPREYAVDAYLDASETTIHPSSYGIETPQDQTSIPVYYGTEKKCKRFIKRKLRRQSISQWVGYLVAGTLGAVLAAVITVVLTLLFLQS